MDNEIIRNTIDTKNTIVPAFEKNNVPICFFSDDRYVPYLGTAVLSAIENADESTNLDVLIFQNGYSDENKMKLLKLAIEKSNIKIRFIDINVFLEQLRVNPSKRVSINCFAKIFCTDHIFNKYDRIIVLDSDLLILQDLMELYNSEMNGHMIAAVKDIYIKIMVEHGYHTDERLGYILLSEYLADLGLEGDNYFNTGVLLLDVKKCQENNIQKKMIEINKMYPTMMYAAQDDFNILFKNEWTKLDNKWNIQNPYSLISHIDDFPRNYKENLKNAGILHYLGKSKPWNDKKVFESELFDYYVKKTEWIDEYLSGRRMYKKTHFFEYYIIPKGSIRRNLYLKICYSINYKLKKG